MSNMRPIPWVFLLVICSTSRKSTLTCTTSWLEMAIFTVRSRCIDIESKHHSSKSRIYDHSFLLREDPALVSSIFRLCAYLSRRLFGLSVYLSPICLHGCLSVCLSVCLSICLSVNQSVCLSSHLPELSVCLSVCLSELSVSLSVWVSCPYACLYACLSGLSVCLVCLSRSPIFLFGMSGLSSYSFYLDLSYSSVGTVFLYCMSSGVLFICLSSLSVCLVSLFSVSRQQCGSFVCLSFCDVCFICLPGRSVWSVNLSLSLSAT